MKVKPLDFGGDGITGSVDRLGRLIAVNFYHPPHGYVTLTSAEPFPESDRYNPAAVRAYRASLASLDGFGLQFDADLIPSDSEYEDGSIRQTFAGGAEIVTFVDDGVVVQRWNAHGQRAAFGGKYTLMRCAYTQLTEGGPAEMPPTETQSWRENGILWIENPAIGAVAIEGAPDTPTETGELRIAFGLTRQDAVNVLQRAAPDELRLTAQWRRWWDGVEDDPLLRRGLAYSRMMAIPVGDGVCLLTDHMLLPLSWNRDAYYLARALLSWHADMREIVRRHLIWMFEVAQRIDGMWARCYLANGQVKDGAFQLDQQIFPLLEWAEYVIETSDQALFERLRPAVEAVIAALLARRADNALLFPTDETPADDPIAMPYHFSSHVLLWATLTKLNRLGMGYDALADDLKAAIRTHFTVDHDGTALFAYAVDGRGGFHLYHDANDFPTILAPIWGFCAVSDPVWRATVAFAFSSANRDGVYGGRLGSVHTRAPWSLGDVQALILARLLNDEERESDALRYLAFAAQSDGALPEAYDAQTGAVMSRTWFAWTNAAHACVQLGAFRP
jgi:hypothetical protein